MSRVGRPKGYDRQAVLLAARDLFWEHGYAATSIADLEQRTGLNRSSIYQEFGSKRGLFDTALECYADGIIASLFDGLGDDNGPGLGSIIALFNSLSELFRWDEAVSSRGCMIVNAIAELAGREKDIATAAAAYRDRMRGDFASALARAARRGEVESRSIETRASILASTLMGVWLAVRIDSADAANLCESIALDIESWRLTPRRRPR
jgi:AcrR family transcriptional regulator